MDWSDVGNFVKTAAPILGTVLGGPIGGIAGAAGSLVASWLGCEDTPEAVNETIQADPEAFLKLKELENAERSRLLDWKTKQLEVDLDNIKDARNREVQLSKVGDKVGAWATHVVALVVTVGFFWMLNKILALPEGVEPTQASLLLLGTLATGFGAVVQYYLGSSLSSARKNEMLKQGQGK